MEILTPFHSFKRFCKTRAEIIHSELCKALLHEYLRYRARRSHKVDCEKEKIMKILIASLPFMVWTCLSGVHYSLASNLCWGMNRIPFTSCPKSSKVITMKVALQAEVQPYSSLKVYQGGTPFCIVDVSSVYSLPAPTATKPTQVLWFNSLHSLNEA